MQFIWMHVLGSECTIELPVLQYQPQHGGVMEFFSPSRFETCAERLVPHIACAGHKQREIKRIQRL
jgi:hypothetical protein